MIYEGQISFVARDDKGKENNIKESLIVRNVENFESAAKSLLSAFQSADDFDVISLKRSKIKEIANNRENEEDLLWLAELQDVFLDDNGKEKYIKYKVLFFSKTYDSASEFITEYAKQGYDMQLVSLKLTKNIDII